MMRALQIFAALLLVLFLVGCSGAPSETNEDTSAQESGDLESANEPAKPVDQTVTKDLKDILGANLKYKATYKITSEDETSIMTMAYDLPKFAQSSSMEGVESRTIYDGKSFIACTNDEGWQCIKMTTETESETTPSSLQTEETIREGDVEPVMVGSCSVAGEKGVKYEVTAEGTTSSVCYTTDGILLEMISEGFSMTATSVSRSVPTSEFVPPAEPVDLTAMMANIPGQ